MKSIFTSQRLGCLASLFASVALTLTISPAWIEPAFAEDKQETIAWKLLELQDSEKRWIQVDLTNQRLTAWEGGEPVYTVTVSTGKEVTPTLTGTFNIQSKRPIDRMRGEDYDVPNVPYAMYYDRGYAIHGAYWHNNFGTPVSHGCINMAVDHAEWLFDWASEGTPIVIHP